MSEIKTTSNTLIKVIKESQTNRQLNDRQFAFYLGIDPGEWSKVSRGIRPPGLKTLKAFMNKLPEVQLTVAKYMAEEK